MHYELFTVIKLNIKQSTCLKQMTTDYLAHIHNHSFILGAVIREGQGTGVSEITGLPEKPGRVE